MPIGNASVAAIGINLELGRSSTATMSIDTAENGGYAAINTCSPSYPSSVNPAAYSEWRNYNHSFACCNTPAITSVSGATSSSLDVYWVGLSNCNASHIEYSTNQSTWTSSVGGCVSPRTISGLASSTTYYFRVRISCTSTGGYSNYSNIMSGTTTGGFPAYGTYLSQYCTGCTLYYRYANGSGGHYDVSQGCTTTCGGCCCAPAQNTLINSQCSGCDYYSYYADGCYGTYEVLVQSNSPQCGCGENTCYIMYSDGSGEISYTMCDGHAFHDVSFDYGQQLGCADIEYPYYGAFHDGQPCLPDPLQ